MPFVNMYMHWVCWPGKRILLTCNISNVYNLQVTAPRCPGDTVRIILCMRPADEWLCYNVMQSLIGWVHTQIDPCVGASKWVAEKLTGWFILSMMLRRIIMTSHQKWLLHPFYCACSMIYCLKVTDLIIREKQLCSCDITSVDVNICATFDKPYHPPPPPPTVVSRNRVN